MKYETSQFRSDNSGYINTTALQIRLDTSELIQKIMTFLTGETTILKKGEDGKVYHETIYYGKPKANSLGIQSILNRVTLILNASYVQGNFDLEQYNREIAQMRRSFRDSLMINQYDYDIKDGDFEDIIDSIMFNLKGFASRLINNKERESYETTLRHIESNTQTFDKRDRGG